MCSYFELIQLNLFQELRKYAFPIKYVLGYKSLVTKLWDLHGSTRIHFPGDNELFYRANV